MRDRPKEIQAETGRRQAAASITAVVLTFDEELHIARCLERIRGHVARIVVVDSFSSDRTVEIAKGLGAEVLQRPFKHQADQFQWALDNCAIGTGWVLKLDADEYLEDGALAEIASRLPGLPDAVTGLELKRKVIFQGQWIRHGRYYSTVLVRLWRTGVGAAEQRWMDEHIVLSRGHAERIRGGDLVDHNLNDIGWWTDKHNRYATRHMVDHINREFGLFAEDDRLLATSAAAKRKRLLKLVVYGRAPLYLRAVLFYLYRYVLRFGFLDGRTGFLFHTLHGLWLMLLIDAKIDEARRYIAAHGIEAFKAQLRSRHRIET